MVSTAVFTTVENTLIVFIEFYRTAITLNTNYVAYFEKHLSFIAPYLHSGFLTNTFSISSCKVSNSKDFPNATKKFPIGSFKPEGRGVCVKL